MSEGGKRTCKYYRTCGNTENCKNCPSFEKRKMSVLQTYYKEVALNHKKNKKYKEAINHIRCSLIEGNYPLPKEVGIEALNLAVEAIEKELEKSSNIPKDIIDKLDQAIILCNDKTYESSFEPDISYFNGMKEGLMIAKKLLDSGVNEGDK